MSKIHKTYKNPNFTQYEKTTFHPNDKINKKIKALLYWFDYRIKKNNLSESEQIQVINNWITSFKNEELYEMIPPFKERKRQILRSIAKRRKKERTTKQNIIIIFRYIKTKIYFFFRK
jgi:hypothetical protein